MLKSAYERLGLQVWLVGYSTLPVSVVIFDAKRLCSDHLA